MSLDSLVNNSNFATTSDEISDEGQVENLGHIDNNNVIPFHRYSTTDRPNKPIGLRLFGSFFKFNSTSAKRTFHKALVLCVTFIAYTCFHMGRRPLSIVKNVLNRNCSGVHAITLFNELEDVTFLEYEASTSSTNDTTWCDWPPFNEDATANQLLALLDSAFLFSYAFFMFFSGFLADRCNLRYFLAAGSILSGFLLYAFGLSFYLNIHSMYYFITIQILAGAIQTAGWPTVVTCIGNWFDQSSRGSIFGIWNSNTNIGNILGATIAGYFVERAWGLSFIVPGFIMLGAGVIVFLFLVPRPEDVGLLPIKSTDSKPGAICHDRERDIEEAIEQNSDFYAAGGPTNRRKTPRQMMEADSAVSEIDDSHNSSNSEQSPLINDSLSDEGASNSERPSALHAVSFWTCIQIPGVMEYSLSLGFAKLVSYTFLYWLPRYITQSTLNNSEDSAYLSVPFDIGGAIGAIIAGYLCDKFKKSASICTVMLIMAMPAMFIYEKFAAISNLYNIFIQLLVGALVTGPYALITTAVSTDLGSRIKDGKAMATVAAIIDGFGSIGAALGPLFAGYVSDSGWQSVFLMLMLSDLVASLCLIRITLKEIGFK